MEFGSMIHSSSSNLIAATSLTPRPAPSAASSRGPGSIATVLAASLRVVPRLRTLCRPRTCSLAGLSRIYKLLSPAILSTQQCVSWAKILGIYICPAFCRIGDNPSTYHPSRKPRPKIIDDGTWRMASLDGHVQLKQQQPGDEATKIISKMSIAPSDEKLPTELYPYIDTNRTGFLKVSNLHTLYWEESGNAAGKPVVFLHGGPGAGTSGSNRRFFDPEHYRIILLDQRGAGRSTPHACTEENTTWDLVSDIEKLREHLGIEKWMVFGGSWGSTLSLTYAETHPERVTGIVLRGIFLLRKKEIDWFYQAGTSSIFPDAWEPYRDFIPEEERHDFVSAYSKRLNSSDRAVQLAAAKAWTNWEMATSHLVPNVESLRRGENDRFALAFARVENHYFMNRGFLPSDSYILDNIPKIKHIPAVIVQGRYDVVCPMMSAWDLHRAWPEAKLQVVASAGHSANEVGISAELVAATEYLKHNALNST